MLKKIKNHRALRFIFGVRQVVLAHNLGHYRASLSHVLGTMSSSAKKDLRILDREADRQSRRVWAEPKEGASHGITHRQKLHHDPRRDHRHRQPAPRPDPPPADPPPDNYDPPENGIVNPVPSYHPPTQSDPSDSQLRSSSPPSPIFQRRRTRPRRRCRGEASGHYGHLDD